VSTDTHDRSLLGGYVLGVLDDEEVRSIRDHLATCAGCRTEVAELEAMRELLGEVPPEAFLDGPPEGGDLLLQRTLRQVRAEVEAAEVGTAEVGTAAPGRTRDRSARQRRATRPAGRQRFALAAASVVAVAVAAAGSGFLVGRGTAPGVIAEPPPASSAATVPGTRRVSGSDARTGATLAAVITPAPGWIRLHADVGGVKAGTKCLLVVRSRDGSSKVAGSWLVSAKGEKDGTALDGTALVAPDDVASIDVEATDGTKLVSVSV
jgi:anti-sigma factor RsiW